MVELIEFPSNKEFYFTAITFVVTLMFEDYIKKFMYTSKGNVSKFITFYMIITAIVLTSSFLLLILNFCMIIGSYICKSGENGNMIFCLIGILLFSYYHLLSLKLAEKENKKTNTENCKTRNLFHNFTDYIKRLVQLNPTILLYVSLIFIAIGLVNSTVNN